MSDHRKPALSSRLVTTVFTVDTAKLAISAPSMWRYRSDGVSEVGNLLAPALTMRLAAPRPSVPRTLGPISAQTDLGDCVISVAVAPSPNKLATARSWGWQYFEYVSPASSSTFRDDSDKTSERANHSP